MTPQETKAKRDLSDNELIADFMGFWNGYDNHGRNQIFVNGTKINKQKAKNIPYEHSFNLLIPVVEKMSEFGVWTIRPGFAMFENYKGEMRDSHKFRFMKSTSDFEEVNREPVEWVFIIACVCLDGIKWYNKTHPSNG